MFVLIAKWHIDSAVHDMTATLFISTVDSILFMSRSTSKSDFID